MRIFVTLLLMLIVCGPVLAGSVNYAGTLTPEQTAIVQLQAVQLAAKNTSSGGVTPELVTEWAMVGNAIGEGAAAAAGKLGIAVNEFVQTPIGFFTMFAIGYTTFGKSILSVLFAFIWLGVTITVWVYMYRRTFFISSITTYDSSKSADGERKRIEYRIPDNSEDGRMIIYWLTLIGICAVGFITFFTS